MALRGCVILLFVLLSGSVNADETAITLAPVMQEQSISQIPTVTQTDSPSSSVATTATTLSTTEAQTTLTTKAQTTITTKAQTTITTKAQTTITTKAQTTITTEAPTTHQNTTNSTTEAPTTTHHIPTTELPTTPHHNTTNSTTEAPTTAHTNATTAPTPPPTTPPVPKPTVGNYSVRPDVNSSACLLAKMGLQFSFTSSGNASRHTINLDPNVTVASGTCGSGGSNSSLVLKSDKITVQFIFTNVSEKFRLNALVLSIGSIFNESNNNLSLWEVSIGSSYMCRKEQTYNISDKLTINTFELQVQPFAVQNDTFSTAHECSMDDISLLIPIIVGAVLAGLIFIVVIAYVIGRRRTYVGYQTL